MPLYRRFLLLLGLLIFVTTLIILRSRIDFKNTQIWRNGPQRLGLGDLMDVKDEERILAPPRLAEDPDLFKPVQNATNLFSGPSPYLPGDPKPYGSTYTKAVVMGRLLSENITWLDTVEFPSHISKYIYNLDLPSSSAPDTTTTILPLPKPKGHEAMVYLTYIIDNYANLADVNIFLHAHQNAWHNNELLNHDAAEMIKRLSAERVTREGYMNVRCHWKPGCPEYIHPYTLQPDKEKQEEGAMANAWATMFPDEKMPDVIASQCCAQFAVSRKRIQEIPLENFKLYRDWLLNTPLDDYVSGRVFEYLWHKIFTGQSTFCPDMRVCYCDGYGVCFEDDTEFDYWFELKYRKRQAERKLMDWRVLVQKFEDARERAVNGGKGIQGIEEEDLRVPAVDGDVVLQKEIDGIKGVLEEKRLKALKAGTDPRVRARVAGRVWREGDGY